MNVLIVAGYYPPHAPSAATRINKLSRFLLDRGHDVHVLTMADLPFPAVLPPEIPAERITYSDWLDVKNLPEKTIARLLGSKSAAAGGNPAPAAPSARSVKTGNPSPGGLKAVLKKLLRPLRDFYVELVTWPDSQAGWLGPGTKAGLALIARSRPDVIYASAPPHTSLLLARRLSHKTGVPWVAEMRDLWTDHPYYDAPAWRRWLEKRQDARVMASAAACVTVTEPWSVHLREKLHKPTALVMNGFDPRDFPEEPAEPSDGPDTLSIVYTGALYAEKRDPEALFAAIARLGDAGRAVTVRFYGPDLTYARTLAEQYGITGQVELHRPIPYDRAIAVQRQADILLLLRWDDPGERTVIAGKLFEYFGARRPILSVGCEEGVAADMIRERNAGVVTREPDVIAAQLRAWIADKAAHGRIAPLPAVVRDGLSRTEQFAKLETFLAEQIGRGHG